jgi:vitamin B12 transporter
MRPTRLLNSTCYAALLLAAAASSTPAAAQAPQELPGIVVQGATLDVPRPAKRRVEPEAEPAPPRPARRPSTPTAATQPQAAPAAVEAVEGGNTAVTTGSGGSGDVAGVAADKIGTSVSVITGEQIRQQNIYTAVEALRSLPGVSVSRQGGSQSLTVVRIRGAESRHTLVRIDGVDVNSGTDGTFDFSNLIADDIEQIEVLRGPQSGLYGSSALAGVINIITKSGKGPLTVRVQAEAGSLGTKSGAMSISGGDDRAHGILSVYGRTSNGFNISQSGSEDDFAEFRNLSFNGGFKLTDNLKIDGSLRRSVTRGGRDDGFGGVKDGFAVPADDNSFFETEIWIGRLQATLDTMDGRWIHKAFVNRAHTNSQDTTSPAFFGTGFIESISQNTKYGYTSTYRLDAPAGMPVRHFVTGLIEREEETFEQPTNSLGFLRERARISGAGEIRGEYFDSLYLSATARRDNNDVFDDFTTWRTSAAYKIPSTPFRLHTSYGTGVKYPSFGEQFGFFVGFAPNPNLKPETSQGWDAGIETQLFGGRGVVDITYFNQDLQNEIDFRTIPVFQFQPFNRTGKSTREGIEVAGRYLVLPGLTFGAAYTYLNAENDDGTAEVRRPKHAGRLDVNYGFDHNRANINVAAIYNGQMKDIAFEAGPPFGSQLVPLKDYWLLSASASYKLQPGVEIYGKVENALNQKYEEVFGFNTPGTTVYAGVRLTFEDKNSASFAAKD